MSTIGYRGPSKSDAGNLNEAERSSKFRKAMAKLSFKTKKAYKKTNSRTSLLPFRQGKMEEFRQVYRANKHVFESKECEISQKSPSPQLVSKMVILFHTFLIFPRSFLLRPHHYFLPIHIESNYFNH